MATSTSTRPALDAADVPLTRPSLPRWAVPAVLLGAVAVAAAVLAPTVGLGWVALPVLTVVLFAVGVYAWSRAVEGSRRATDRLVTTIVTSAFLVALVPLVALVWTVLSRGAARFDTELFTSDMRGVLGSGGGVQHAIVGTLLITLAATVISVPIGLMTAIYLVEYGRGKLAKAITFFVDVMTGIPSIVAGLFAYALFVIFFGPGVRLGIAGAVSLSVLMVPVVIRSSEEMLKLVPNELREASYALGVPKWRTITKVVIPTAVAGIATGVTIAIARVIGETAPLLLVAGFTSTTNWSLFEGRMTTLPVFAYSQYVSPGLPPEAGYNRAWAAALVLILIVMALNVVARLIARFFAPQTGR
ncbi:phosphate ABC transporter permease PstA [Vallicoccus soli]|uniref:Phosphate transport system permease protein PstA n=1 Tax=Vallicoccus soli TaxID=2339232 RepID=A0A3A3Z2T6_9ACTN|nr:phosphate ABC transporter permease PstA [Vallicoccus soli]RJK97712.1 phosphate ABC transporter permease PstA [Vallicoccus soli]